MGEKAKNFGNRLGNTAMIAPRVAGTAVNTASDTVNALVALPKDALDVISNTTKDIRDVFINSWTKGKRYQRVGNVILSPVIATGTAIEGAVRTAVTPVVNGIVNGRNTVKNTVTNTRRSTFGRVFSKKPISDFSYDKLNTADVIKKDKNRFSRLQFGKKSWSSSKSDKGKSDSGKAAAAGAVAATAAAATAASAEKTKENTAQIDALTKKINEMSGQLAKVLENNERLAKENTELKRQLIEKKETKPTSGEKSAEGSKKEGAEKKGGEPEKKDTSKGGEKETKEGKPESKPEGKPEGKDDKKDDKKVEGDKKEKKEIKDEDRISEYFANGSTGEKIWKKIKANHPDITIKYDNSTKNGHINGEKKEITIGTQSIEDNGIRQTILHELTHILIQDNTPGTKELLKKIASITHGQKKTLFSISISDHYDTRDKKVNEDACELVALFARDPELFDKKMESLQSKDSGFAQISKDDASGLKDACKKIIDSL